MPIILMNHLGSGVSLPSWTEPTLARKSALDRFKTIAWIIGQIFLRPLVLKILADWKFQLSVHN
jgi:hypothetical protein